MDSRLRGKDGEQIQEQLGNSPPAETGAFIFVLKKVLYLGLDLSKDF
jgi:hypothetical protein